MTPACSTISIIKDCAGVKLMLRLSQVKKAFAGRLVLDGVDLTLAPGQVVCVTGPSGCGKTTLLNLVAGILLPDAGSVENGLAPVAYVFQEPRLLPWRTVVDNIAFGLKARGVPRAIRRQRATALARRLGLGASCDYYPAELSGGMQQRVAIGRALAIEPKLLLLDEPFSALDFRRRADLHRLLLSLLAEQGVAALFVTHDMAEAVRICHELVVLSAAPARVVGRRTFDQPPLEREAAYIQSEVAQIFAERFAEGMETTPGMDEPYQWQSTNKEMMQ